MSRPSVCRVARREDSEWTQRLLPILLLLSALTFGLALGGCNTTAGMGEDMSAAGHAVTNSAEQTKKAM